MRMSVPGAVLRLRLSHQWEPKVNAPEIPPDIAVKESWRAEAFPKRTRPARRNESPCRLIHSRLAGREGRVEHLGVHAGDGLSGVAQAALGEQPHHARQLVLAAPDVLHGAAVAPAPAELLEALRRPDGAEVQPFVVDGLILAGGGD